MTLFELMSNPDLLPYRQHLMSEHPLCMAFLVAYIIFGSFGMIAVLTGLISESMLEKNQVRICEERMDREWRRKMMESRCGDLFDQAECDEKGEAKKSELKLLIPIVSQMLTDLEITFSQADLDSVIDILGVDNGYVSRPEFIHGIVSIAEGVRPLSILEMHHDMALIKCQVE